MPLQIIFEGKKGHWLTTKQNKNWFSYKNKWHKNKKKKQKIKERTNKQNFFL